MKKQYVPSTVELRLAQVMEECAELTQACSKALRFGSDVDWKGVTNKERIKAEYADVMWAMRNLMEML